MAAPTLRSLDDAIFRVARSAASSAVSMSHRGAADAALLRAFRAPGPPPRRSGESPSERDNRIAALVLDGWLEVDSGRGFTSGPAALDDVVFAPPTGTPLGRTAELSILALRYGQQLRVADPQRLQEQLYRFNSAPASPRWLRRLPSEQALRDFVLLRVGGDGAAVFGSAWRIASDTHGAPWVVWYRSGNSDCSGAVRYKLYISPLPQDIGPVLGAVAPLLAETGARAIKMGQTVYGILRSDKLIVYFPDFDSLGAAAARLEDALRGIVAHGVPFTASCTSDGLLSWGIDPVCDDSSAALGRRRSWRRWITTRLARGLRTAQSLGSGRLEPWQFALARIALDGIDPRSFGPTNLDWAASC